MAFFRLPMSISAFLSLRSNSAISFSVSCRASSSCCFSCRMEDSLWLAVSYAWISFFTSSGLNWHSDARMPPFATWWPPPLIVPLVSMSPPSCVTTRQRLLPWMPMRVACERSLATSVFVSANQNATAYSGLAGLMRSTSLGTPSGVSTGCCISRSRSLIFWRETHVARPRSSRRMNSMTACASSVRSTTIASSMPHAVETATSYFLGIVPRSPRRPWTPLSLPALDCS
mmetsp:Transcript_37769/g.112194  ORF Transcript_37769/g.112194 Transcript_37769/m.112194 type:complete len:229 (-) Transcript_37769:1842-2528(-)